MENAENLKCKSGIHECKGHLNKLLTRLLTNMRLIAVNWGMLYVMISECYLIDDGCIET